MADAKTFSVPPAAPVVSTTSPTTSPLMVHAPRTLPVRASAPSRFSPKLVARARVGSTLQGVGAPIAEGTQSVADAVRQRKEAYVMADGVPVTGQYVNAIKAMAAGGSAISQRTMPNQGYAAASYTYADPNRGRVGSALQGATGFVPPAVRRMPTYIPISVSEERRRQVATLMGLGAAPPNLPSAPRKADLTSTGDTREQEWVELWCRWMFPANPPPPGEEAFAEELQERCRTGKKCGFTGCGNPWTSFGAYQREIPKLEFNVDMPGTASRVRAFESRKDLEAQIGEMKDAVLNTGTDLLTGGTNPPVNMSQTPPAKNLILTGKTGQVLINIIAKNKQGGGGIVTGGATTVAERDRVAASRISSLPSASIDQLEAWSRLASDPSATVGERRLSLAAQKELARRTALSSGANTALIVGGVAAVALVAVMVAGNK